MSLSFSVSHAGGFQNKNAIHFLFIARCIATFSSAVVRLSHASQYDTMVVDEESRPWQHMVRFQANRFRHNSHVEVMKFIRPRRPKTSSIAERQIIHLENIFLLSGIGFYGHFAPDRGRRRSLGARFVFRMYTQN